MGETESATGPPPSQAGLRARLLQGATWALALTGWSYILTPRMTLSAYFGASGAGQSPEIRTPHDASWLLLGMRIVVVHLQVAKASNRVTYKARLDSTARQGLAAVACAVLLKAPDCCLTCRNCCAGDQADVLMWRAIGVGHLLLANITQNLEVCSRCISPIF